MESREPTLDLSLVVLASNECESLDLFREMMATYRTELEGSGRTFEVIVVDDGVGDEFFDAACDVRKEWPAVRILRFRRVFGESVVLDVAVSKARGRHVITSTWYLQVDTEGIRHAVERLEQGVDFVAFRREPRIDGLFARWNSWLFNAFTRRLTGVKLNDLNCSFRAFRREVVEETAFHGDLFRFLGILADQRGFRVEEIPVRHINEQGPSTFLHPGLYLRRFLDVLSLFFLIKFTHKPLRFFGLVGSLFFLIGFLVSLWLVWLKLFEGESLAGRPMLVLGVFLTVLGIIVGSIGLIGEIIIFTNGQNATSFHIDRVVEGEEEVEETGTGSETER